MPGACDVVNVLVLTSRTATIPCWSAERRGWSGHDEAGFCILYGSIPWLGHGGMDSIARTSALYLQLGGREESVDLVEEMAIDRSCPISPC